MNDTAITVTDSFLQISAFDSFRSLEKYYVIGTYFLYCNLYVVRTVKAIEVIVQLPSLTSFITPMYHFVVPSSSSSISTLTRRFSKSGRSLSLSPTGQQKSKRKNRLHFNLNFQP